MNANWQQEFELAMQQLGSVVPEPIEYRLYYDDTGRITMCSQQNHPESGQYIVVDSNVYVNYSRYAIDIKTKKPKIVVASNPGVSVQLKKSTQGYAVVRYHAGLILENNEDHKDIEYYEATC